MALKLMARCKTKTKGEFAGIGHNRKYVHAENKGEVFKKLLVANRGEIACRIVKTARKMGIKTVALYSTSDVTSCHVKLADEKHFIGPSPSQQSYGDISKIMDAVRKTHSEAVHPGYGFLSENAAFVELLEQENVAFVGPSAAVIRKMGDKLESKRAALAAGVNTIPGFDGIVVDEEHCVEVSRRIGYPVMIKASAGGGGKGMRIALNDDEAREGFKLSSMEALSSFGDKRMVVEKYIKNPRHIEIQVLGDKFGNYVHLNERECSIQRRNQKIIEEAPSTFLDEETRRRMGEQSVKLCEKLGYYSAGTLEFLVDRDRNFYFLEMNTRLQVEHPVTECTTGLDLVQEMLRVAKGLPLTIKQNDVKTTGWAVECRIYAEDPSRNFGLPNTGRIYKYSEQKVRNVRYDSGVDEGSDVSIYYDNLLCKLTGFGADRSEAVKNCLTALDSYVIRGVSHNIPLLRDVLSERNFRNGNVDTSYLHATYPDGFNGRQLSAVDANYLSATAAVLYAEEESRISNQFRTDDDIIIKSWDLLVGHDNDNNVDGKRQKKVKLEKLERVYHATVDEDKYIIHADIDLSRTVFNLKINADNVLLQLISKSSHGKYKISYEGTAHVFNVLPEETAMLLEKLPSNKKTDYFKFIKSPMPGLVSAINCKPGDVVSENQELCIIEAMKMQNSITSPVNGKITQVFIKTGNTVGKDDLLFEME